MKRIPVALVGVSTPYREAVASNFGHKALLLQTTPNPREWVQRSGLRVIAVSVGPSTWSEVARLTGFGQTAVVALVSDPSVNDILRALAAGCGGVCPSDCSSRTIANVIESAALGEVVLASDIAQLLVRSIGLKPDSIPMTLYEIDLLQQLANGGTVVQLADRLGWSERTIRRHLNSVYMKLGVANRAQAITRASQIGAISASSATRSGHTTRRESESGQ